jgi:hypothetical protein
MRSYYSALILIFVCTFSVAAYLGFERHELNRFCDRVHLGDTVAGVRKLAELEGFEPELEPYAQLRIQSRVWSWNRNAPSCRVFLNAARTVEYRVWQGG